MQSHVRTVLNLFEIRHRYIVPMFQRQYVWTLERQWTPLWEDIERKVLERLRWYERIQNADAEEQADLKSRKLSEHFLGAIVLDQHPTFGNQVPVHLVIDGQQRLTTCQVFLVALRDAAKKHDVSDYLDELKGYVANRGIMADPTVERFKVWPSQFDQPAFKSVLDAGGLDLLMVEYPSLAKLGLDGAPRLAQAYAFFAQKLEDFLTRAVVSDRLQAQPEVYQRVKALFETFQQDLQIVSIELEGQDDPQVIFETLNRKPDPAHEGAQSYREQPAIRREDPQDRWVQLAGPELLLQEVVRRREGLGRSGH